MKALATIIPLSAALLLGLADTGPAYAAGKQLKFAFPAPARSPLNGRGMSAWAKDVNAASKGAVEVKVYPGPVLGNFANIYDRTLTGVTDISFGLTGPVGGQFRRTMLTGLPFESKNSSESSLAMWRLYESGVIAMEFENAHPLGLFHFPHAGINSKEPVMQISDLKNMKMAVSSKVQADLVSALGATPVTMAPPAVYQSLNRGVISAVLFPWTGTGTFKSYEVAKNHFEAPLGSPAAFVLMNKKSYAGLSTEGRRAIDKFSGEAFTRRLGGVTDGMAAFNRKKVKALPGQTIRTMRPGDVEKWKSAVGKASARAVKATPDGPKVLAAFRAEINKIRSAK
ncbi:MAG: TRAP transporter substrate-binding protein [Rhodospirillales bacterium]|nr:TRAP transporter substrate-binding protein [Rhodospirillales bacterium]